VDGKGTVIEALRPAIGADRKRAQATEILQQSQEADLEQLSRLWLERQRVFLLWFRERGGGAASIETQWNIACVTLASRFPM